MLTRQSRPFALCLLAACAHTGTPGTSDPWARVDLLETRGTLVAGELRGTFTSLEEPRTGRNRTSYTLGPMSGASGFDGTVRWRQDPGGEVVTPDSPDARARDATELWLARRGYLQPSGARIETLGERPSYTAIRATPDGGIPVELWFDRATHDLARSSYRDGLDTVVTVYSNYRELGPGLRVPYTTVEDRGDPRSIVTTTVQTAVLRPRAAAAQFSPPTTERASVAFTGGARRTELPFDLINNHIYISATIDDRPVRMLVDTGGLNVLTQTAAKRLALRAEGKLAGRGVGEKQVDVSIARPTSLAVGHLRATAPVFYVYPLEDLVDIEGAQFDGIVGFELFHRFTVRIDYAANRIAFLDPADFHPPAGAIRVPFTLKERMPLVEGSVDGIPARFTIDTGARNSLTANAPFVAKRGLLARYKPRGKAVSGWGAGGSVSSYPVRFHEVTLGDAKVREVAGDLFTDDKGALADPDSDGNLGGGILHRFVVTFDYAHRAMYLEPIPGADTRDPYDRAGWFFKRSGDALEILSVDPDSPASRAAIRAGDRIVAIDNAPTAARTLAEWRRHFTTAAVGTKVAVRLDRAGARIDTVLTLAELLP